MYCGTAGDCSRNEQKRLKGLVLDGWQWQLRGQMISDEDDDDDDEIAYFSVRWKN